MPSLIVHAGDLAKLGSNMGVAAPGRGHRWVVGVRDPQSSVTGPSLLNPLMTAFSEFIQQMSCV